MNLLNNNSIALCIPAYNSETKLRELLLSAQNQLVPFDEILVYDDCSNDNTKEVAIELGATIFIGDENKGCSYGKNFLANHAKSNWLHFHDSDDLLLPDFTVICKKWIDKYPNCPHIVLLNYDYVDYLTKKKLSKSSIDLTYINSDPLKFAIENKLVNFALINKDKFLSIEGFDIDYLALFNEDKAFYLKAAINNFTFGYEPSITSINYLYSNSMSNKNKAKCCKAQFYVIKKYLSSLDTKYNESISKILYDNATFSCSIGEWKTAFDSIKMAKKLSNNYKYIASQYFNSLYKVNPYLAFFVRAKILAFFAIIKK